MIDKANKESYRYLFETEWPGQTRLSGRSDIYAYFFLRGPPPEAGRLPVTSIAWLDTAASAAEFFLRNFRIVAVIESQVEKWSRTRGLRHHPPARAGPPEERGEPRPIHP